MPSYYETLEIGQDASPKEIKKAYRALAKKYHPDTNPGDESASQKFKAVAEAYEVLSSPEKRRSYDAHQSGTGGWKSGFNPFDFFRSQRSQKGPDTETVIDLEFMESIKGTDKDLRVLNWSVCQDCTQGLQIQDEDCETCNGSGEIIRKQGMLAVKFTCRTCRGVGKKIQDCGSCLSRGVVSTSEMRKITVPPGIDDDAVLRIPGMGMPSRLNGPKGDLLIRIRVKPHPVFVRSGGDIHVKTKISYTMACLGGEKIVSTLNGDVSVKIPEGVQQGKTIRLKGKGVALPHRTPGDQYCHLEIDVIKKPTERIREILRELDEAMSTGSIPSPEGPS